MALTGIDAVVYGVTDMDKARRFYADWGVKRVSNGKTKAVFETQDGSQIVLRPSTAKNLPKAIQRGSTVREIVWGASSKADLTRIQKELSKDREVTVDKDGTIHSADDMGLGIAFRVSKRKKITTKPPPVNSPIDPPRVDKRATYYDRAQPIHIGHAVFGVPDLKTQQDFYTKRLGFKISDHYTGLGVFLRCAPRGGHHNLFFMQSGDKKASINHVAFSVRDIHELFAGGIHVSGKGWPTEIGPGRHRISSCYFWYFTSPAGGAVEYFYDEDYLTEKWKPGRWNAAPEVFAEWVVPKGLKRAKRKPPTRQRAKAN